ncbi:MAG: hypothetical protein ABIC68_00980 [Candidatus Omnitrophota bacterium]
MRACRIAIGDNWYNPATNVWGTQIEATADLVVEGRVGIGTRSPAVVGTSSLEVSSGTSGDAYIIIESDEDNSNESDNPTLLLRQDSNIVTAFITLSGDAGNVPVTGTLVNSLIIGSETTYPNIQFATNDAVRMTIETTGDVGIGTTNPNVMLDVRGDTNLCVQVRYTATSTNKDCPGNYYFMYPPGTPTPDPTNYYICCRGCADWDPDGICDE